MELKKVESGYEGDQDLRGFLGISEEVPVGYKNIRVYFKIEADVSENQKEELIRMAQKYSPVFNSLAKLIPISVQLDSQTAFVYCLFVLRTVRSEHSVEASRFIPYLPVNIGMLLGLASLAVLIYFIHHVSQGIQAENLIADVGAEFQKPLPVLFPERIGLPQGNDTKPCRLPDESQWQAAHVVISAANGYLQGGQ